MNILISSAGRRVSLVRAFQKELISLFPNAKIFTCDQNPDLSSACQIADSFFKVPPLNQNGFIDNFLELCITNEIKLIVPTIDTELQLLSEYRNEFLKSGIEIVVSDSSLISVFSDKRLTASFFKDYGIQSIPEIDKSNPTFPLFVKPLKGSAGIGLQLISDESMLSDYLISNPNLLFQKYIDPQQFTEFTIDLYYDKNSHLSCIVPRERLEVRGGEVSKGVTRKNHLVDVIKSKLDVVDGLRGAITLQLFSDKNSADFFAIEINPRFGGGYPLSYSSGANFPRWILLEYLLNDTVTYFSDWKSDLLMLRYDDQVLTHS